MSANRGKYAEGKVREWLQQYKGDRSSFTFNRILDAHSSKGAMSNPQAGDFQWFQIETEVVLVMRKDRQSVSTQLSRNGLLEIKEVEHQCRLPYKNFGIDQVGRMRIRAMAGSEPLILVCFRPAPRTNLWRSAPLEFFENRDPKNGSWDMSDIEAYPDCDTILKEYLK